MFEGFLKTKLFPPPARSNQVKRYALLEKFDLARQRGIACTLVSAPAGFGKTTLAVDYARSSADAAKFRTSPVAVVIASEADDKASWVRTGQVYERLALKMTSLDIKSAFLNQPIEVSTLRGQFQSAIGLGSSLPQLLVRFGYAEAMPRSLRRPVEEVLI